MGCLRIDNRWLNIAQRCQLVVTVNQIRRVALHHSRNYVGTCRITRCNIYSHTCASNGFPWSFLLVVEVWKAEGTSHEPRRLGRGISLINLFGIADSAMPNTGLPTRQCRIPDCRLGNAEYRIADLVIPITSWTGEREKQRGGRTDRRTDGRTFCQSKLWTWYYQHRWTVNIRTELNGDRLTDTQYSIDI